MADPWKPKWLLSAAPKLFRQGMTPAEYAADEAAKLVPDLRDVARHLDAEAIKPIVVIVNRLLDSQPGVVPGPFVRLANVLTQDVKNGGLTFDRFEEFNAIQAQACLLVVEIRQRCVEEHPSKVCLADTKGEFRTQRQTQLWHLPGSKLVAQLTAVAHDLEAFAVAHYQRRIDTKRRSKQTRGRKPLLDDEVRRREEILAKWGSRKAAKTSQKDFCRDEGIERSYLDTCVDWDKKRRRRLGK